MRISCFLKLVNRSFTLFKRANCSFCSFCKEQREWITFFKRAIRWFRSLFYKRRVGYKFLRPVFSFPTPKKSESLFHKEPIALVFEKVKRAFCSFCSIHSFFKDWGERVALVAHFKSDESDKSDKSERAKERGVKERKNKRAKELIPNPEYCTVWHSYGCTVQ